MAANVQGFVQVWRRSTSRWNKTPIELPKINKHSKAKLITSKQKNKIKKMKSDFKLTGLSKPQSFTCEPLNSGTFFWAKNGLGKEKFNELWNYCDGNWQDNKIAEIEHEGLNEDGTPINPVVVGIREVS